MAATAQHSSLPSHHQLVLSLIDALSTTTPGPRSSPPHSTPSDFRRRTLLLTLHVLFPSMVLPALDLLDRRLVSCLSADGMYAVESSASPRRASPGCHLVLLHAWNCSCAAFALDAYARHQHSAAVETCPDTAVANAPSALTEHMPCCRHLLACLLARSWRDSLGDCVQQRQLSREELAAFISEV